MTATLLVLVLLGQWDSFVGISLVILNFLAMLKVFLHGYGSQSQGADRTYDTAGPLIHLACDTSPSATIYPLNLVDMANYSRDNSSLVLILESTDLMKL
jgi:hypothetical protein